LQARLPVRTTAWRSGGSGGASQEAIERLKQLGELHDEGILTDEEFNAEKEKILGS
jgi:hypothetical protein